jgi:hypothetical protein
MLRVVASIMGNGMNIRGACYILKGIASYKAQQREILEAIRRHGGRLHQNDFDKEFGEVTTEQQPDGTTILSRKAPRLAIWSMKPESFILGSIVQSGDWSKYLDLTQLMVRAGLLRIEGKPPNVVYVANATTKDAQNAEEQDSEDAAVV